MTPGSHPFRGAAFVADSTERVVNSVEAWIGAFFTSVLSLGVGIPLLLATMASPLTFRTEFTPGLIVICWGATIMWLWLSMPHLYRTWSSVRHCHRPLAPAVAFRQRKQTIWLRPISTAWYGGFFLLGMAAAVMTERMVPPGLQGHRPLGHIAFSSIVALFYTFAGNGFLLAAVKAATGSDLWVQRAWSWRIVIDVGLVGIALVPTAAFASR